MFISTSVSSDLEFGSVNQTSIYEKSELKAFKNIKFLGEYLQIDQKIYWGQTYTKLLNHDNHCLQYYNELNYFSNFYSWFPLRIKQQLVTISIVHIISNH